MLIRNHPVASAISLACAGYAVLAGAASMLGWFLHVPRLTDWFNQGISMLPNTALCAILGGVATALTATRGKPWKLTAASLAAGAMALIGGLTLGEHLSGFDLGIDALMSEASWGQNAAAAPMRMGPPASSSYLILGTALILSARGNRSRRIGSMLTVTAIFIAMLSITGYWFGADQLFGVAKYTGIALQTSIVIAVLSIGIMATIPDYGITAALCRNDTGGAVFRRLLVPIIVIPLVLGWLRILGQNADLYDLEFGTALRTLIEIALLFGLLWWTANSIGEHSMSARSAESRLAAIVESSEDAIVSKTLDGVIQSWNSGAERVFGYTAAEVVGRHISLIIPPERMSEEANILDRIRRGNPVEHFETVRVRKDGQAIDISLTVSPIRDANGRIVGASKIARDVTLRKQLENHRDELLESERLARAEAERASHLKDEFLATLSHELRTPLNAIVGWSQILDVESDRSELEEGLDAIQRNARAQAHLIEDLLDMSRIISGKVRLEVQPVNMATVVEAAIDSVRPAADAKSIRLRKVLDDHAAPISGDPNRLQQVVWNLLTNAIKFTPKEGKIDVILNKANSHLDLTVRDNGIGIAKESLPIIFERFRQVDSSTTRSYGGLGIGLSIVKQLVELHGGSVTAESEGEGKGATFVITLPILPLRQEESNDPPSGLHLDADALNLTGVKVLIVDDEPDARALVERMLAQCGAEIRSAGSAIEGLNELRSFQPDVLVSDIGMPGTDGYQFIKSVRGLAPELGGKTPAIALTAFARSEDRMKAMLAGYQVHVSKPIEPRELAVTVQSLSQRN